MWVDVQDGSFTKDSVVDGGPMMMLLRKPHVAVGAASSWLSDGSNSM